MTNKTSRYKTAILDKDFFMKSFEPARRRAQASLGINNLSQARFTRMLYLDKVSLNIKPKTLLSIKNVTSKKSHMKCRRKVSPKKVVGFDGMSIPRYNVRGFSPI